MSLQPNRVVARIVEQVAAAGWPRLDSRVGPGAAGDGFVRVVRGPLSPRYATAMHFWVHALREDLAAVGRREDLKGAALHAQGRRIDAGVFLAELRGLPAETPDPDAVLEAYRMLESDCRRSSVARLEDGWLASFWMHGAAPSWQASAPGPPVTTPRS